MGLEDCIDLTDDTPEPAPAPSGKTQSRYADLTEAEHRMRIMGFAKTCNEKLFPQGLTPATRPVPSGDRHLKRPHEDITVIDDEDDDVEQVPAKPAKTAVALQPKKARHDGNMHGHAWEAAVAAGRSSQPASNSQLQQLKQEQPAKGTASQQDQAPQPPANNNTLMKELHDARMRRQQQQQQAGENKQEHQQQQRVHSHDHAGPSNSATPQGSQGVQPGARYTHQVSILTYNVWFKEELALRERMQGIADVIEQAAYPDFLLFQEVTPLIVQLWREMPWWSRYSCCAPPPHNAPYFTLLLLKTDSVTLHGQASRVPFNTSQMGRDVVYAQTSVLGHPLLVGTSHLESPVLPQSDFSEERRRQQQLAIKVLSAVGSGQQDTVYAGDLNWTEQRDGPLHLPEGWCDAWAEVRPGEKGYTYDSRANAMLLGFLQIRMDRFLTHVGQCFEMTGMEMVGTKPVGKATYVHPKSAKVLPVLPSDHFGVLLTLKLKPGLQPRTNPSTSGAFQGTAYTLGSAA